VKRGDVRWAEHPDWPRRPALVLTRNEAIDHLNEVFGPADGMPRACVLNADHVASLPKGYLGDRITSLSAERLAEVCRALDHAIGC
jgi:mRNA-degrading endonuclease toxin of MazEF toxin-antitoxin module